MSDVLIGSRIIVESLPIPKVRIEGQVVLHEHAMRQLRDALNEALRDKKITKQDVGVLP